MTRPLTKRKKPDNSLYVRPEKIEKEIDDVIGLDLHSLTRRLFIADPKQSGYLSSETLMHLIRHALSANEKPVVDVVIKVLFSRCEAILQNQVLNSLPNAQNIREEVLAELGKLIAREDPERLDVYECRFNLAFRNLRIDVINRETLAVNRIASVSDDSNVVEVADLEAAFDRVASFQTSSDSNAIYAPSPEDQLIAREIYAQIHQLPRNERDALIETKIMGMTEQEAGKKLGVSDRTIGTRKRNAIAKLKNQKERT